MEKQLMGAHAPPGSSITTITSTAENTAPPANVYTEKGGGLIICPISMMQSTGARYLVT
ncbi:MAG: hypothetical protein WCS89_03870 [Candidatus Paceibacterota bacterium]|jgi:hypothetical protein